MVLAWFHGIVVFVTCSYGFSGAADLTGRTEELWFTSSIAFSCIIHIVTGKLIVETLNMNWIVVVAGLSSVLCYWVMCLGLNFNFISWYFQPELEGIYFRMFTSFKFYIAIICVPPLALLPDMTIKYMRMIFFPTPSDVVMKIMKQNKGESGIVETVHNQGPKELGEKVDELSLIHI